MSFLSLPDLSSNMVYYKPKKFIAKEFVDPQTYSIRGEKSLELIDARMLWTMDELRNYFKKSITINNWCYGGERTWSGLRTTDSPYYSKYSQHTFGRAIDFIVSDMESAEVRAAIKKNFNKSQFKYITAIEDFDGMDWVHIDCRSSDRKNGLQIFGRD